MNKLSLILQVGFYAVNWKSTFSLLYSALFSLPALVAHAQPAFR